MNAINLEVVNKGDKLFMVGTGGHQLGFALMLVKNITRAGMIDLCFEHSPETVYRFNTDGTERDGSCGRWRRRYIDTEMTVADRTAYIAKLERAQQAANALHALVGNKHGQISKWWEPAHMNLALDKLQDEIDAARQLVKAI